MTGEDLCSYIELRAYNSAGARYNARFPAAQSITFTDELAADGAATFRISPLADTFATVPDLLEGPGFGKAAMVLTAGAAPVEVFGWELVPTSGNVGAEPGQREKTATAPGLRHLFDYGVLHTVGGTWDRNTEDSRFFGWMSPVSAYWYNSGDWSAPSTLGAKNLAGGRTGEKITADTTPAAGDVMLFRTGFTMAAAAWVTIYWQCDDVGTLYVDSKQIDTSQTANTTQFVTFPLTAGSHVVAAEVTNGTDTVECGFAAVVYNRTTNSVIRRTDTTNWVTHKVSGTKPGMSAGAILRTILDEAQAVAQGVYGLNLLTPDFDGQNDSNGSAWSQLQEVAFPIGTSLGDIVRHLEELDCDVHIKPDFTLQAFKTQGSNVSATVWFKPGVNLDGLTYQGTPPTGTVALVRTPQGWVTATDSAGVTAYGKRYISVTSGTSASASQGARVGARALDETASPRYVYSATIHAVTSCVPFLDFKKGDTVTCPDRNGTPTAMRVLSITASTPDDAPGPVSFTVELDLP